MSLIDVARDALKDLPVSDILRERLSLALDQSAAFERQIGELQTKIGHLQLQLEIMTADFNKAKHELQKLEAEYMEEVFIHKTIEFRRGKRTGGKWLPFCPKCHAPTSVYLGKNHFQCTAQCGWIASSLSGQNAEKLAAEVEAIRK